MAITDNKPNISVCVCTYKRPQYLDRLLRELEVQETGELFTYSIVVVDNDQLRSAEPVVSKFAANSSIPITYCVETQQNISLTRNRAVANAHGEFLAFIDDDEFPVKEWLLNLLNACDKYQVDGALGPVKRHFDETPPKWLLKSKFYDRKTYPTGTKVDWREGRTGNVLVKNKVFADGLPPFKPEFRGGEDTDWFGRMNAKGYVFIWCDEAVAHEVIPPSRWKRSFMLKRALLRGAVTLENPHFGPRDIAKSFIAVPLYLLALPFAYLLGQHKGMPVLVKLCDHLGKLLAIVGIDPMKVPYVTE